MKVKIEDVEYPDAPGVAVGSCYMNKRGCYFMQRENDVLIVNVADGGCINSQSVGRLTNYNEDHLKCVNGTKEGLIELCDPDKFATALNNTMFNMKRYTFKS